MININEITKKYSARHFSMDYLNANPVPWIALPDFLPDELFKKISQQVEDIPKQRWTKFTRNGSYMEECTNNYSDVAPLIRQLNLEMNSSEFVTWLEDFTKESKLIPDPHMVGGGLMKSYKGHSLKMHTDFNWNEELHLNRQLNLILYLSKEWQPDWQGGLQFRNFENTETVAEITPEPNTLLMWKYHPKLRHGHPHPMTCPDTVERVGFRIFYYTSNSTPEEKPHRSLYYEDEHGNPVDKK